jgi:lipoprotein signal peptidase
VWATSVLCLDLVTKYLAAEARGHGILSSLIAGSSNAGLSMGVATAPPWLIVFASAVFLAGFGGWCVHLAVRGRLPAWVPGLLIGGATANLIDRIVSGAVHDWVRFGQMDLNLADLCVLAGVVGLTIAFAKRSWRRGGDEIAP